MDNDIPCRVTSDTQAHYSRLNRNAGSGPTKPEIEQKRRELAEDWLEHQDNAAEALNETLLSHRPLWVAAHAALVDQDDNTLGMKVRAALMVYAERCTLSKLESWLDRYSVENA